MTNLIQHWMDEGVRGRESSEEPLIQLADYIVHQAIQLKASDIHIEPDENYYRIRFRQHGILSVMSEIPFTLAERLITRYKVLAKCDITDRRLPQDGRFSLHSIDIRVSTCPTLFGEKIVLRLLYHHTFHFDLHNLGLTEQQRNLLSYHLQKPQGMILVTGPTGAGKTVTLYAALRYLNTPERNIATVEDPIEITLSGINQVNIQTKQGMHFSTALRAILRQDPDIIMVGEIRDRETAEIAMLAAQTGHLVLSTLHTNNTIEAISRLRSLGISTQHIANSISLLISQRLVRMLCEHCKQFDVHFFNAKGCSHCHQGYLNRIAIYEFLPITQPIAHMILKNANTNHLLAAAKQDGFLTLSESAMQKAQTGLLSLDEIKRVIQ